MTASINPDRAVLDRLRDLLREAQATPMGSPTEVFERIQGLGLHIDTIGFSQDALTVLCVAAKPDVRAEAGLEGQPFLKVAVMHDGRCLCFDDTPSDKVGETLTRRWVNERAAVIDRTALFEELKALITLQEKLKGGDVRFSFMDVLMEEADETGLAKARLAANNQTRKAVDERIALVMREIDRLGDREPDGFGRSFH